MMRKSLLVLVLMATGWSQRMPGRTPSQKRSPTQSGTSPIPPDRRPSRLRHQRGHVDECGRQPGRHAGRLRPARRCLSHADRRRGGARQAPHERAHVRHAASLAPMANASRSRATVTGCGTSGRWTSTRTPGRSRASGAGSSTVRRGRRMAATSTARRHFVKERSLGAGEIWMYHSGPSDGLQVTERTGWQKDAGEPDISPDGSTLYYSKDVTRPAGVRQGPQRGTIYAIIARI